MWDGHAVFHHVQHGGDQRAGVQGNGLAGLQVDLHAIFLADVQNQLFQRRNVVAGAGDVVPAAQVQPF